MTHPPEGIWTLQQGQDTDLLIQVDETITVGPTGLLHPGEPVIAALMGRSEKPTAELHSRLH